ncbi:MAG: Crp/Fnr family transcriptional regulator, partial [Ardenticatenaceae bacterium]
DEELSKLAPICRQVTAQQDEVVFFEGSPATHVYGLVEGQIALQKSVRLPGMMSSRRTTVTLLCPGSVFGCPTLIEPYIYGLTAAAWTPIELIKMDSGRLRSLLEEHPSMERKVLKRMSKILSKRLSMVLAAWMSDKHLAMMAG